MAKEFPRLMMSGGSSNSDPSLCLGGAISSTEMVSATFTNATPVSGITLIDATGQPDGDIIIDVFYDVNGSYYSIIATNSAGEASVNARYYPLDLFDRVVLMFANDNRGSLLIEITDSQLPSLGLGEMVSGTATLTNVPNNLFNDTTVTNVTNGESVYRCLYIKTELTNISQLKAFIPKQPPEQDTYAIAFDPAGAGGTAIQIVDELDSTNLLAGLTFTTTDDPSSALEFGNLAGSSHVAIWIRKTTSTVYPASGGIQQAVYGVSYHI